MNGFPSHCHLSTQILTTFMEVSRPPAGHPRNLKVTPAPPRFILISFSPWQSLDDWKKERATARACARGLTPVAAGGTFLGEFKSLKIRLTSILFICRCSQRSVYGCVNHFYRRHMHKVNTQHVVFWRGRHLSRT